MNGKKLVGWLSRDGIAAVMNVKQTYTVTYTDGSDPFELGNRSSCHSAYRLTRKGREFVKWH